MAISLSNRLAFNLEMKFFPVANQEKGNNYSGAKIGNWH
jgi:hypothetical protein